MKRVKAACICQTLHFMLKDDLGHDYAVKLVKEEVEKYKASLDKNRTKYKIVSEETQSDGSVMIKIIKQYNTSPVEIIWTKRISLRHSIACSHWRKSG